MKLRIAAFIFGMAFLALGLAWHLPLLFDNDLFLGLFTIDSLHNKVHIVSGLMALAASSHSRFARLYLKIFGGIYVLIGTLGFIFHDAFMAMQVNNADNGLYVLLGLIAVVLGYKIKIPTGAVKQRILA